MIGQLTHIRLLVPDVRTCVRFYRDVMGFELILGGEEDVYVEFKAGDIELALFAREAMAEAVGRIDALPEANTQDTFSLIFAVENVDKAAMHALEAGLELINEPMDMPPWGIRVAHFRDPAGNLIEVNHPLPEGMQGEG